MEAALNLVKYLYTTRHLCIQYTRTIHPSLATKDPMNQNLSFATKGLLNQHSFAMNEPMIYEKSWNPIHDPIVNFDGNNVAASPLLVATTNEAPSLPPRTIEFNSRSYCEF